MLTECSPKQEFSSLSRVPANEVHETKETVLLFEPLPMPGIFQVRKLTTTLQS